MNVRDRDKVPMPMSHVLANRVWTKVFNMRNGTNVKDVGCGLMCISDRVLEKMDWDKAPGGWGIDAWMKREAIRVCKENGWKVGQSPVGVTYWKAAVEAPMKVRLKKYSKMFAEVMRECIR